MTGGGGSVCLQGHSTLQASQDFSTLLTWTAGMNSQKTVNAAATTRRKSKSRIASQVHDGETQQEVDSVGHPGTEGCQSKPCSVFCCVSVCIDRAVFASIEDSDSDLDNHGEDSSSNTSADDHMTTKRSECCLQGAGVKEVRGQNHFKHVVRIPTLQNRPVPSLRFFFLDAWLRRVAPGASPPNT